MPVWNAYKPTKEGRYKIKLGNDTEIVTLKKNGRGFTVYPEKDPPCRLSEIDDLCLWREIKE